MLPRAYCEQPNIVFKYYAASVKALIKLLMYHNLTWA